MRRLKYVFMGAAMLVAGICVSFGQTMDQLKREIEQAQRDIRLCTELMEKSRQDQKVSQSNLKIIEKRISSRRDMLTSLEKRFNVINNDITSANRTVRELNKEIDKLKADYARMVYASYKNHKLNNFLLFLFSAEDFNDATRRVDFMRRYNRARSDKARQIAALSDSLTHKLTELDKTRAELNDTRATHSKELSSLGKDEKQYRTSMDQLKKQENQLAQQVKQKQQQIAKAQKQIDAIIAEEVRRARAATTTAAEERQILELSSRLDENKGKLPYPVKGGVIIDRFGKHAHQIVQSTKVDNPGINIAVAAGAEVFCVFDGIVTGIYRIPVYNTCLMVRHGNYITVYANLVGVSVKSGDKVSTNQRIGKVNDSNDSDANFLHFEIRRETQSLNPEEWLRR